MITRGQFPEWPGNKIFTTLAKWNTRGVRRGPIYYTHATVGETDGMVWKFTPRPGNLPPNLPHSTPRRFPFSGPPHIETFLPDVGLAITDNFAALGRVRTNFAPARYNKICIGGRRAAASSPPFGTGRNSTPDTSVWNLNTRPSIRDMVCVAFLYFFAVIFLRSLFTFLAKAVVGGLTNRPIAAANVNAL